MTVYQNTPPPVCARWEWVPLPLLRFASLLGVTRGLCVKLPLQCFASLLCVCVCVCVRVCACVCVWHNFSVCEMPLQCFPSLLGVTRVQCVNVPFAVFCFPFLCGTSSVVSKACRCGVMHLSCWLQTVVAGGVSVCKDPGGNKDQGAGGVVCTKEIRTREQVLLYALKK